MKMSASWQALLLDEAVLNAAWQDLQEMADKTESSPGWANTAARYPSLIFEAGQGLALDQDNAADFPHLTPSHTTSLISARRIAALSGKTQTEILYVTRSYLTRHGAGPFPTECPRERINPAIVDRTNVPNPHQQSLRFGFFDGQAVLSRIQADKTATCKVLPEAEAALLITHLNETEGQLCGNATISEMMPLFDRVYLSDCPWEVYQAK